MYQTSPFGAELMAELAMDSSQFALLFSAPMAPGLLAIIAGLFIDRIGPKQVIGAAVIASAIGCVLRVFATSYPLMLAGSVLAGVTTCFLNAGAVKIIAGYFPPEEIGARTGVLMSASTLAMTVALLSAPLFGGYRMAFIMTAVMSVIGCALWWLVIKNPEVPAGEGGDASSSSLGVCLRAALSSKNVVAVAFGLAFVLAANVALSSFMPMALASKGIAENLASIVTSFFTIGCFAGCYVGPALVSAFGGKQKAVMLCFCLSGALGIAFSWLPASPVLNGLLLFATGICAGGLIPMTFALPMRFEEIGMLYAGTAGGVVSTVQTLGAILIPSYVIAPVAGGDFGVTFLLAGATLLLAAACYSFARID